MHQAASQTAGAVIRCSFPVERRRNVRRERERKSPNLRPHHTRVARMLALAQHVERLIEAGELSGYAEAARALGVTRARLTQVMNLLLLAPEIQKRVYSDELETTERALRVVVRDASWSKQEAIMTALRRSSTSQPQSRTQETHPD